MYVCIFDSLGCSLLLLLLTSHVRDKRRWMSDMKGGRVRLCNINHLLFDGISIWCSR